MNKNRSVKALIELALWDTEIINLKVDDVVDAFNAVSDINKYAFKKFIEMQKEIDNLKT